MYYRTDLHPLLHVLAAVWPYAIAVLVLAGVEFSVRRARAWANRPRPYDWERDQGLMDELVALECEDLDQKWNAFTEARARRGGLSVVDQRVQSELWPNVTPLYEVTGSSNKTRPA